MLAHLSAGDLVDHPTALGALTERLWLDLFARYLPERYRAASAFVVDSEGKRSRQIDIAIHDRLYSPLLFPEHIPAESVYAVFEVKQDLNQRLIRDAGRKAASVRRLRRTPATAQPILAGILALRSGWRKRFARRLPAALAVLGAEERLDLGCALEAGAFEVDEAGAVRVSTAEESLIFFTVRLLERLRALGTAPAADLMEYARRLESFAERQEVEEVEEIEEVRIKASPQRRRGDAE